MRRLLLVLLLLIVLGGAVFWFLTIPETIAASALAPHTPNLENGKTMFHAGGCASCHATPDQEDRTRLGGGMALKSPFGTFYAPNISSDAKDGIGGWSEANFVTAMWRGTSPDGRHYYPAFPYASYQKMKMEDVRDLFAHLKTLPAVEGSVRDHDLSLPYSFRRMLGGLEIPFPRRPAVRARSVQGASSGIAAPIWSTARVIARSATARAIAWAGSSKASASPAVPIRKAATVGFPTSPRLQSVITRSRKLRVSWRPANCPTAIPSAGPCGASCATLRSFRPRIGPRWRPIVKSLPPVEGPKPPGRK